MNWFSGSSWLWKALRGSSVTFAALFALSLLGISVVHALRHVLGELGVPWLALIILPIIGISAVAKRERNWMPDEEQRKRWSRRLVFGAIAFSLLIAIVSHRREAAAAQAPSLSPRIRMHGPSGK